MLDAIDDDPATAAAEKAIPALAGATPPPLSLTVSGMVPGMNVSEPVTLQASVPPGATGISVEYLIDGQSAYKSSGPDFGFQLDPGKLSKGTHLVKVIETDDKGRVRLSMKAVNEEGAAPAASEGAAQ